MENELLEQILTQLNALEDKMNSHFIELTNHINDLEVKTTRCLNELSRDIPRVVSDDVAQVISSQLNDIKTEVSIIKSAVGEHELDLKYFKKVTIPNFKSPTL